MMLELGETPAAGRTDWPHRVLPERLRSVLLRAAWRVQTVRDVVRHLKAAYAMRIDADYRPTRTVDAGVAKESLRAALTVVRMLRRE